MSWGHLGYTILRAVIEAALIYVVFRTYQYVVVLKDDVLTIAEQVQDQNEKAIGLSEEVLSNYGACVQNLEELRKRCVIKALK